MIRLRKLRLENFLSHRKTELSFSDEAYVILGENASGKTSILRGIFFALFGEDLRGAKRESLINRRANSGEVELTFLHRGREYTIRREISVRRNGAYLFKEGSLEASGVKHVKDFVRNSLGLLPEMFKNTVFVPQGEIVSLLRGAPLERRKVLNRLLGLEEFEKKHEELKAERKELENYRKYLEGLITTSSPEEERERLEKRRRELEERIRELSVELDKEEKRVGEVRRELERLEETRNAFTKLSADLTNLERKLKDGEGRLRELKESLEEIGRKKGLIGELRREISPLKGAEELRNILLDVRLLKREVEELKRAKKEKEELLRKRRELEEKIPKLEREVGVLRELEVKLSEKKEKLLGKLEELKDKKVKFLKVSSEVHSLSDQVKKLSSEIPTVEEERVLNLQSELEEKRKRLEKLNEELLSLRKEREEIEEKLKLLSINSSRCPLCGGDLTDEKREFLIREADKRLSEISSEVEDLNRKISLLREEILTLEGKLKESEELLARKRAYEERRGELLKRLDSLKKEFPEFDEGELRRAEEELSNLEGEILKTSQRRVKLEQELRSALKELEEKPRGEDVEKLDREIEKKERELDLLMKRARELKELHGIPVSNGKELSEFLEKLRERERLLKRLEGEVSLEGRIRGEIEELERELRDLKEKKERLKREIEELSFDEKLYRSFKESSEALFSQFQERKETLSRLKGELSAVENSLKEIEKRVAELRKLRNSYVRVRDAVLLLKEVERSIHPGEGFLRTVRNMLLPQIAHYCKEFFSAFDFTFGDLFIDENLTVTFGIPGQGTMSLDDLSGGQQVAFALALRFAMARNFSQRMELLVLDEPTVHLDSQRRASLTELLTLLKSRLPQMFIVTHDPELEVVGDKVIRVRSDGGVSIVEIGG